MTSAVTPGLRQEVAAALGGRDLYETGRRHHAAGWTADQVESCMETKEERHVMEYWRGFYQSQRQRLTPRSAPFRLAGPAWPDSRRRGCPHRLFVRTIPGH